MFAQNQPVALLCLLPAIVASSGCSPSPEAKEAKFLNRGQVLFTQKDYARALLEFKNALGVMPQDAEPYYRMGLVYLEGGDMAGAARSFQKATALNPKHSAAQLKLAELMTASKDEKYIAEAVSRLHSAFGESPDNPEAIDTLALAEWELGKPQDAIRRFDAALEKFPGHLQSSVTLARMKLSANDRQGAEDALKAAVATAPRSSPAALALGELYLSLGEPAKAESEFRRSIELDPTNSNALRDLGAIQIAAKRMDEAEQTCRRIATLPEKVNKPVHALFLYYYGDRDAALVEFQALAQADPDDREARSRLFAAFVGTNRREQAESLLAAALKRNPKDTDALLQRAGLRLRQGNADEAEKDLRQVLYFSPDSVNAHFELAMVYRAKGSLVHEQEELQQVLQLAPSTLAARLALEMNFLAAKHARQALEMIDQAPDEQKKQLAWTIGRNWALLALSNWEEAKAGIDRALQVGRPSEAVYQSAVFQLVQRDYAGARAALEELLNRNVEDVGVVQLLMQTYASRQEVPKGLDRLKDLVAKHPDSAPLRHLLGQWYERGGNLSGARQAFENAKAIDSHFTDAALSLAELDLREGQSGPARQRLSAIVARDPKNVGARVLLARSEKESGDQVAEIETYRAILAIEPSNLIALNNLAYELGANSPDEALKFAQQAVELAPDEPGFQDTLGWVYYRKGLYTMAVRYLKTAVDKESNPRRQFHLGMSYVKAGDQITGQTLVRAALQKDPNLMATERGW